MKRMEEKILEEGGILPGGILKVGTFLNHNIDTALLKELGQEIARLFADESPNKILTIEASGIALAVAAGMELGIPVVFAKKHQPSTVDGEVYLATVRSFTQGRNYDIVVSRDHLGPRDRVLLVDDFLANGNAMQGLIELLDQAGSTLVGAAVGIEKVFQEGGNRLRERGIRVEPLAAIEALTDDEVIFARGL